MIRVERGWEELLDQGFAFVDLQAVGHAAQVYGTAVAAHFAADTAGTQLVRDGGVGFEGECDAAAMAAAVEFPGDCE